MGDLNGTLSAAGAARAGRGPPNGRRLSRVRRPTPLALPSASVSALV
jgi:hypothetical protein